MVCKIKKIKKNKALPMNELRSKLHLNETVKKLNIFKEKYLNSEHFQLWIKKTEEAKNKYHQILKESNFKDGGNLNTDNLKEMFSLLRNYSSNRSLSRLIYEENSIELFNQKLRNLYYGEDLISKRINDFLTLSKIGEQSLSQFLVIFDDERFPLSTDQSRKTLNLDTDIEEDAKNIALERFKIDNPSQVSSRTLSYLTYNTIYEEIKVILDLEKFDWINKFLWKYGKEVEEKDEDEDEEAFITLGLEKDLRRFLALNPHVLEKGLVLVENGEEYETHGVGRIDLLFKDKNDNFVVVELKRKKTGDPVVGQILRYIGWVIENLGENVRGMIVIGERYDKLDYSLKPIEHLVQLKYYQVKFEISDNYHE